jgi:ABC-2 type transport system ATP-binding protein
MIVFEGLTKTFGTSCAVNALTFCVPKGAIFGFLGPNGAGKTTTLKMLMGLLAPTRGRAMIGECDVTTDSLQVKRQVGYLPDEVFLYDYLTGQQFLEFVADIHGLTTAERQDRIKHYVSFFDLENAIGDYTANYSFGMKKKLALAGIVLHRPSVLLLDEPFNGLDPQAVRDCRELLKKMAAQGATIMFSSHVLEVVEKLVSHVGIISQGSLKAVGELAGIIGPHGGSLEKAFFAHTREKTS